MTSSYNYTPMSRATSRRRNSFTSTIRHESPNLIDFDISERIPYQDEESVQNISSDHQPYLANDDDPYPESQYPLLDHDHIVEPLVDNVTLSAFNEPTIPTSNVSMDDENQGEVSYDNGISWKPVAECDGYTPSKGFDENRPQGILRNGNGVVIQESLSQNFNVSAGLDHLADIYPVEEGGQQQNGYGVFGIKNFAEAEHQYQGKIILYNILIVVV